MTLGSTEVCGERMGATDDSCVGSYLRSEVDERTAQVDVRMGLSIDVVVCPFLQMFMDGIPYHTEHGPLLVTVGWDEIRW